MQSVVPTACDGIVDAKKWQIARAALAGIELRFSVGVEATLLGDGRLLNVNPKCEAQLGRCGFYRAMAGEGPTHQQLQLALLCVLNQSDGSRGPLDIAEQVSMPFALVRRAADIIKTHDRLGPC